jgi:hypothetical protein
MCFVLTVYLDESGTHDKSHFHVMAGYASTDEKWKAFDIAWDTVLRNYDINYFHMKDCAHFIGEFAGWDEDKRKPFLEELIRVIHDNTEFGIGIAMGGPSFTDPKLRTILAREVFIALALCQAIDQCVHLKIIDRMFFVFDQRPKFKSVVQKAYDEVCAMDSALKNLLQGVIFADDKTVRPLQAADFLAYEINKLMSQDSTITALKLRKSLRALMNDRSGILLLPVLEEAEVTSDQMASLEEISKTQKCHSVITSMYFRSKFNL